MRVSPRLCQCGDCCGALIKMDLWGLPSRRLHKPRSQTQICLHTTDGQKLLPLGVELGESWKKPSRVVTL